MRDVASNINGLDLDLFTGRNDRSQRARRNILASHVRRATKFVTRDKPDAALIFLNLALRRVDGDPSPRDWMIDSMEKDAVRQDIELLMALIVL